MASKEQPLSLPPQGFPLHRLPPELRDHIWTFTLPDPRVFDVDLFIFPRQSEPDLRSFGFGLGFRHPPPVTLQICHESRAAALRAGFFLKSSNKSPGSWFRPETDMIYFHNLSNLTAGEYRNIEGLDKVLHVGIFWACFLGGFSVGKPGEMMEEAIQAIHSRIPSLETLNSIFLRHRVPLGQEIRSNDYQSAPLPPPFIDDSFDLWLDMAY